MEYFKYLLKRHREDFGAYLDKLSKRQKSRRIFLLSMIKEQIKNEYN